MGRLNTSQMNVRSLSLSDTGAAMCCSSTDVSEACNMSTVPITVQPSSPSIVDLYNSKVRYYKNEEERRSPSQGYHSNELKNECKVTNTCICRRNFWCHGTARLRSSAAAPCRAITHQNKSYYCRNRTRRKFKFCPRYRQLSVWAAPKPSSPSKKSPSFVSSGGKRRRVWLITHARLSKHEKTDQRLWYILWYCIENVKPYEWTLRIINCKMCTTRSSSENTPPYTQSKKM